MLRPTNRSSVGVCAEKVSIPSTHTRGKSGKPDATTNCQGSTGWYAGQLLIAHPPFSHPSLPPSSSISPPAFAPTRHGSSCRFVSSMSPPARRRTAPGAAPPPARRLPLTAASSQRYMHWPPYPPHRSGTARLLVPLRLQHVASRSAPHGSWHRYASSMSSLTHTSAACSTPESPNYFSSLLPGASAFFRPGRHTRHASKHQPGVLRSM